MLEIIKEFFSKTSWGVNLLFLFLAIIGILATLITFVKSRKTKLGAYRIRNFNLITEEVSNINGLEIKMNQSLISNLSTAYVAIWNNGTDLINTSDIAPSDKVRISCKDNIKIFGYELDFTKEPINNIKLQQSSNGDEIQIDFDYLGKNDGLVMKVFHDGSKEDDLVINGTIKGVGNFQKIVKEDRKFTFGFWDLLFKRLKQKSKESNSKILRAILFLLIIITIPIAIPLMVIDFIRMVFKQIPREYLLEKESDS